MTTNYHDPITTGAAANASVVNTPLADLDAGIGIAYARADDALSFAIASNAEIVNARSGYPSLDARLDTLENLTIVAGGNVVTLANGVSNAGQKTVTVDSTTGFVAGGQVEYLLNGTTLEYNTIDTVTDGAHLLLTTDIGTGGILDNSVIGLISASIPLTANAIPHGTNSLTLPQTMEYANGSVFNPAAYTNAATPQAKIQAAIDAAEAAAPAVVILPAGEWEITTGVTITEAIGFVYRGGTIKFNPAKTNASEVNCIAVTASGVVLDGIVIDGSSMDTDEQAGVRRAIYVAGESGTHIENVTVHNCTLTNLVGGGPWVSGGTLPPNTLATHGVYMIYADYCNVLDNRLDNINGAGIIFNNCTNVTVQRNRINDTQWGSIDLLQSCSHFDIAHNIITGDRTKCRYYADSITLHSEDYVATTHVNVHHNIISGTHSYGGVIGVSSAAYVNVTDNIIYDVPAVTSYIRCNTRSAGAVYGPACKNITISGNIMVAQGQYSNAIGIDNAGDAGSGTAENIVIANNQIISPDTSNCFAGAIGLLAQKPMDRITIANNAISAKPNSVGGVIMLGAGALSVTGSDGSNKLTNAVITGNHLLFLGATSADTYESGIAVGAYAESVIIRNNTIDGYKFGLRIQDNSGTDVVFEDNYFANCDTDINNAVIQTYLGRVSLAGTWYQDNVAASQSAVVLKLEGNNRTEVVMPVPGSIVGIAVFSNAARSAGTLTVTASVDGVSSGVSAVLNGSNTTTHYTTQRREYSAYTVFTAGQRIGVLITTDGSWAPETADIMVNVLVSL